MAADLKGVAFFDDDRPGVDVKGEELLDHRDGLGVADDLRLGVTEDGLGQRRGVVGLHVVDDDVVQLPAVQQVGDVLKEEAGNRVVDGVEEDGLAAKRKVRVVRNPLGDRVNVFKQRQPPVVAADPIQGGGELLYIVHICALLLYIDEQNF